MLCSALLLGFFPVSDGAIFVVLRMRKGVDASSETRCPVSTCMVLLGGAWTPKLIWHLQAGARRFSELEADMRPISAKMLSRRLKELERKGVLVRQVMPTTPPSVEYSLTGLGLELVPAIEAIAHVGFKLKQSGVALP